MIKIGSSSIGSVHIGGDTIADVYVGSDKVFSSESLLPEGYQRLAYISGSEDGDNGGYINTGIIPSDDMGYQITFSRTDITSDKSLFGCRKDGGSNRCFIGVISRTFYVGWNTIMTSKPSITADVFHTAKVNLYNDRKYSLDNGTEYDIASTLVTIGKPFILIGTYGTSAIAPRLVSMSDALFTRGSDIIAHFIPCISPNNEVGAYDIIGESFYGSGNANALIAGPVIG